MVLELETTKRSSPYIKRNHDIWKNRQHVIWIISNISLHLHIILQSPCTLEILYAFKLSIYHKEYTVHHILVVSSWVKKCLRMIEIIISYLSFMLLWDIQPWIRKNSPNSKKLSTTLFSPKLCKSSTTTFKSYF